MSLWRGLVFRVLAVGLSTLAVVALAEIALRLLPEGEAFRETAVPRRLGTPEPRPDFRGRPDPRAAPKPPGTFRILVVGDSFTWGDGVYPEDTYPRRLERRLRAHASQPRFEVVSWSRPGWNTEVALRQTRAAIDRLAPDLLILGFVLNDPEPTDRRQRRAGFRHLRRRAPEGMSAWLHARSRLYRLLWERWENRRQRRDFLAYYQGLFADGPRWHAAAAALRGFDALRREREIPMLLVIFPVFDSQLDRYAYGALHTQVRLFGEELGLAVLDLLPFYRGVDARRLAAIPFTNPHPSELAHRLAADRILTELVDRGMVPLPAQR